MKKIKVALRKRKISKNRSSLYLDFYPAITHAETGNLTRRESLGKYTYNKPKTLTERQHNDETNAIAQKIQQIRQNEFDKPDIYTEFEKERLRIKEYGKLCFIEYFEKIADKRKGSTYEAWIATGHYLKNFTEGHLTFSEVNEKWCNNFKEYLLDISSRKSSKAKLSPNSALCYFTKIKAALKQAFKEGILQVDLGSRIDPIKPVESHRQFLTIEELTHLYGTSCPLPTVWKKASMFSALTGLRFSDIQKLTWKEILNTESDGYLIEYTQKKTGSAERLQISYQAYQLLGDRTQSNYNVFEGLNYSGHYNYMLQKWVSLAGISKHITFHCFRHTYATLLLSKGVDLFTVSKMLGHKDIKTTQIYAKVTNATKRKAADVMHFDFLQEK